MLHIGESDDTDELKMHKVGEKPYTVLAVRRWERGLHIILKSSDYFYSF
jgi:hypothetical protein